jgi:hypothetical protein
MNQIEFYKKDNGEILENTDDMFFVMNNEVYCDNQQCCESQEATIGFDDFVKKRDDIGWRSVDPVEAMLHAQPMSIGDEVVPINDEHRLVSGCSYYAGAVVVSLDPFVLVSRMGDMRWSCTVEREHFYTVGRADPSIFKRCMKRLGG